MAKKKVEGAMTKTAAVKEAIAAGHDQPTAGAAYIKEKFGLEVTTQQFSTYKSVAGKKKGKKKRGRPAGVPNSNGSSVPKNSSVDPIDLARQVKGLVQKYGAESVKEMAGVFAG